MERDLRQDAESILRRAIEAVMPDTAVRRALGESGLLFAPGRIVAVAIGKAAWQMAHAAYGYLGEKIDKGIVITKYGHSKGEIPGFEILEAGHPVPDENSFAAGRRAVETVKDLKKEDTVLFLVSGGGSALFEIPLVPYEEIGDINAQLLASGADIKEINTVRKRLSAVKGGRFAEACLPAQVFSVILSDVLGDPVDMIASGPAVPDSSTCEDAARIMEKYSLRMSPEAAELMKRETPEKLGNASYVITGSVRELCLAASRAAEDLGYETQILSCELSCEAKDAGRDLGKAAYALRNTGRPVCLIEGGETVVRITGGGLGGRNQEFALSAASEIAGADNIAVFSVGSDGTDGPTDAAGGFADGTTEKTLSENGISIGAVLLDNDSYHALEKTGGLIFTGPTGTNVNDVAAALIRPRK